MAATDSAIPVNGSYAPQNFEANNYSASSANSTAGYSASQQQEGSQAGSNAATSEIPKDEVGWYFVEQYYTTLSKSPDKLYLFYNKRSQFVSGTEEDKVNVCVGQKAINDRIKELDFHDTKVRVTNVDSQGSDANIVIQVIGEISNRGQPHKRFVQTFVLAAQTNGYFVLNDIFRYLAEEPEEEEELQHDPTAPAAGVQEPVTTSALPEAETEVTPSEDDLTKVDQKLEDAVDEEPTREASPPPAAVNGTPVPEDTEVVEAEETPAAAVSTREEALSEEAPSKEPDAPVVEEEAEPEKPKDPAPTPAPAAPKAAPVATPAAPPKPAAPRTWASLAASAHRVAMPAIPASVAQPPSQAKAAAPAPSQPLAVPAQTSTPGREPSPANSQGDSSGWQTAGPKKEPARVQNQASVEAEPKRAYIKNVYSQVEEGSLRSVLSKFGDIEYLDISRPKNCAFVDFKTAAGYQNAISNNPHIVNGIEVKVEERRPRPQQPFYPRGGAPRGRGGIGGQPRGGFQHRGRGGPVGRGGRGAPQEA